MANGSPLIESFLYFGYVPRIRPDWSHQPWAKVPVDHTIGQLSDAAAAQAAARTFGAAFDHEEPGPQVVLLSGGFDSRAILGALLERYNTREIVAATYGTPGTLDYELGKLVARDVGVAHVPIDLSTRTVSILDVERVAREFDQPMWLFGSLSNRLVAATIGNGTYWSGYLGGPVTGSHTPVAPSRSWELAAERHVARAPFADCNRILAPQYDPATTFPAAPVQFHSPLTLDERVDLVLRQHAFLAPEHAMAHQHCAMPYLGEAFLNVMFNARPEHRRGQILYKRMLARTYTRLFELPLKGTLGLKQSAGPLRRGLRRAGVSARLRMYRVTGSPRFVPPNVNHVEWNGAFRRREDLRVLAMSAMKRLAATGLVPWCDLERLVTDHIARRVHAGLAISQLISLQAYLDTHDGHGV